LNLPKELYVNAFSEARIARTLENWAVRQRPSLSARVGLLRSAKLELAARQENPLGFTYGLGPESHIGSQAGSLNQCFWFLFSLQARVRL
jgi:hypothetical protein